MRHWKHNWIPIKCEKRAEDAYYMSDRDLINTEYFTRILYGCWCGKLKTKRIEGHWEFEDMINA